MLETLIALFAPHYCKNCQAEGSLLCAGCIVAAQNEAGSRCYKCHTRTNHDALCGFCKQQSPLQTVWVGGQYEQVVAELVHDFKFARARAAAEPLAALMHATLPYLADACLVPIPTASQRVRMRGYDQTLLLARELARLSGAEVVPALRRRHSLRQVGASRQQRFAQAEGAFELLPAARLYNRAVVLVDDVLTTGATLEAAARLLKQMQPKHVSAAVAAQQLQ